MNELSDLFKQRKMLLIVSLPANSPDLAAAASAGGADALKIHLNVKHAASGTSFGTFEEEKEAFTRILSAADIPVGVMPGSDNPASPAEMKELEDMGVAFYDIYVTDMPAEYLFLEGMELMAALGPGWRSRHAQEAARLGAAMIEASIVPHEDYGSALKMNDLMDYSRLADDFSGPVVVPTQKAIKPGEVKLLSDAGVRGLMIGKIVTGGDAAGIEKSTAAFRKAIDAL